MTAAARNALPGLLAAATPAPAADAGLDVERLRTEIAWLRADLAGIADRAKLARHALVAAGEQPPAPASRKPEAGGPAPEPSVARVVPEAMPGVCVDIDGFYWPGHGPGSACRVCGPNPR
jgi:hypothetical protein